MDEVSNIRTLLKQHFPNVDAYVQASNTRHVMLMWPINDRQLFNFSVNRADLLKALESDPVDCYDLFKKANIPKWNIEHFNEIKLKFSAK